MPERIRYSAPVTKAAAVTGEEITLIEMIFKPDAMLRIVTEDSNGQQANYYYRGEDAREILENRNVEVGTKAWAMQLLIDDEQVPGGAVVEGKAEAFVAKAEPV